MRLAHIQLKRLTMEDTYVKIEGVTVWQPYGWFVRMVLDRVTGLQFSELEDLIRLRQDVQFMDGIDQTYDHRKEIARIEMYDREHIDEFVRRGALRNPRIMLELGRERFAKLELLLRQHRKR